MHHAPASGAYAHGPRVPQRSPSHPPPKGGRHGHRRRKRLPAKRTQPGRVAPEGSRHRHSSSGTHPSAARIAQAADTGLSHHESRMQAPAHQHTSTHRIRCPITSVHPCGTPRGAAGATKASRTENTDAVPRAPRASGTRAGPCSTWRARRWPAFLGRASAGASLAPLAQGLQRTHPVAHRQSVIQ
jgi:hypothetical protein